MRKVNGRRMPSDGKSSHCPWQGELKGCTRLAAISDKAYQLLAHGRWFSPGLLRQMECNPKTDGV